jgi:hypothetical protein
MSDRMNENPIDLKQSSQPRFEPGLQPGGHRVATRAAFALFSASLSVVAAAAFFAAAAPSASAQIARPALDITGYVIDAELDTASHHLAATAQVTFTAPSNLDVVTFGFHPALKVTKITDDSGKVLEAERTADGSIRVTANTPFVDAQPAHWTFVYDGVITGNEDGPVEGLKLAAIQEPISYLLYAARWFPSTGFMTDRFTAEMHIRVPQGMRVFASGSGGSSGASKSVTLSSGKPGDEYDFSWPKPGFPGTVIAGRYLPPVSVGAGNVKVYVTITHQASANQLAQTATSEYNFFTDAFGLPPTPRINIVELPDDTLPAVYAPEIAAIMGSRTGDKSGIRLLANTIAHQWWGLEVSPKTLDDAWITNGMSRYGELMYVEDQSGESAMKAAMSDVAAGALAYDTVPLTSVGRMDPFSPQFQSMTLEKGAMIFHMLRWEVGDKPFLDILKSTLSQYAGGSIRTGDIEKVAEAETQQELVPFFSQWIDGTGAPTFANKYSVYRLGNNKGFRTIGEINQDLDLFRMPVDLRIETEGKTENKRIEVVGTDTQYVVDTFGRPRSISVDPNDWVLKASPDLQVRISILKGQQLVAQGDLLGAITEYKKALDANSQSSLASYRIGEVLFTQCNYQASVNAFRDSLHGDDEPTWTEVWAHIAIGKIFDVTGQRDRAVGEYRLAVQTNDNTQGAVNQARQYLQKPYAQPDGVCMH